METGSVEEKMTVSGVWEIAQVKVDIGRHHPGILLRHNPASPPWYQSSMGAPASGTQHPTPQRPRWFPGAAREALGNSLCDSCSATLDLDMPAAHHP